MSPQEPSCSRILPPSARDFPIICPGASGTISERDSQFESASLQRRVSLSSAPWGCRRKAPHFGGGLRVAGDVRRGRAGREPGLLRPFSLTGIDAVPPPQVLTIC